jgi:cyclic beta-1,2-glucan synthetase
LRSLPGDPRIYRRNIHVGCYLVGNGFPKLAERTGFHPPLTERMRAFMRAQADYFYITGIELITVLFLAILVMLPLLRFHPARLPDCSSCASLPTMQCAVELVNNTITSIFDPDPLPKLDFSNGIPAEYATLVAVPSLLLNESQVRTLVNDLEVRFLANRDAHLHFALLSDLPDSVSKPRADDTHPLVDLATQLIDELNAKYGSAQRRQVHLSPSSPRV